VYQSDREIFLIFSDIFKQRQINPHADGNQGPH